MTVLEFEEVKKQIARIKDERKAAELDLNMGKRGICYAIIVSSQSCASSNERHVLAFAELWYCNFDRPHLRKGLRDYSFMS